MEHDPFKWGRPDNATYGDYDYRISNAKNTEFPSMHTQQPIVTGTSVIAIKYKNGIVMAADNLGSYGSLARFSNIERLIPVGKDTVVGISGDISDLQYIERALDELEVENDYDGASHPFKANHIHEYLNKLLYQRRSKLNPLWNAVVVAGINSDNEPFLAHNDLLGVQFSSPTLATGFGAHLAIPLLRKVADKEEDVAHVTKEQAREAILQSMKVLFYRDARSSNRFSLVTIDKDTGISFEKDLKVENMSWKYAETIKGYGNLQKF
ncbi:proteasome core particle subunit beta 7 [Saccharomycopsis crataegensis]|uniref:Proteasome subunit beta n=1 Tax=Saccharomycopsis crataegensis TaxID=43959 RepID=A0AAV5QRH1_9ASCO|nr:proteasome core particle subunit beta 7 [Saccharomycopsis crataegensis]